MKFPLTVIVLTHNDELRIVDCLERLSFASELIVVDDNSIDRTVELAHQFTNNIKTRKLNSNFSDQRNYALNFAKNEWVLFIDSDELLTESLKREIVKSIESREYVGYFLKRIDKMWGRKLKYGEVGQVSLLRLAKKRAGKWHGRVHETWRIVGKTAELDTALIHEPHASVSEFLKEIDEYSTLRSKELFEKNVKAGVIQIIFYPLLKFIQNYFFRQGYKDGIPGFIYAMMMSFHSFLVRGKLYLIKQH